MPDRFQLPRIKPEKSKVTFESLYEQQQVLATMQNFIRMAIMCTAELNEKFQNPENNRRFQRALDDLYAIHDNLQRHPRYVFKTNDTDLAFDVSGETYELNKCLSYLSIEGINAITESIKAAIQEDKNSPD